MPIRQAIRPPATAASTSSAVVARARRPGSAPPSCARSRSARASLSRPAHPSWARNEDRPELGADAAGPQPPDVRLQVRDGRGQVGPHEVVAAQVADRPRQVVVAVEDVGRRGGPSRQSPRSSSPLHPRKPPPALDPTRVFPLCCMEFVIVQQRHDQARGACLRACRTHKEEPLMPSPTPMPRARPTER